MYGTTAPQTSEVEAHGAGIGTSERIECIHVVDGRACVRACRYVCTVDTVQLHRTSDQASPPTVPCAAPKQARTHACIQASENACLGCTTGERPGCRLWSRLPSSATPDPPERFPPFLHVPGQIDRALTRLRLEFFHVRASGRKVVSGVERGAEGGG